VQISKVLSNAAQVAAVIRLGLLRCISQPRKRRRSNLRADRSTGRRRRNGGE
jgi:hypothetical protein